LDLAKGQLRYSQFFGTFLLVEWDLIIVEKVAGVDALAAGARSKLCCKPKD